MTAELHSPSVAAAGRVSPEALAGFCREILRQAGANEATADAATRAMMHGSIHGIDSHGVRLLNHYVRVLQGGRINGEPDLRFAERRAAVAMLDADHAHGALAAYAAMARAIDIAAVQGIGAVGIRNTSHFGPAGAYSVMAPERGMIGIALCNADSFMRLHGGAEPFHGTNPIAVAAPSGSDRPWLLDMATSAITYNRMALHRSLNTPLPDRVASTATGEDTTDAGQVAMLAPLGGVFGYKGAGLAGMVEIFSAVLTGMKLSFDLLAMEGDDIETPRGLGAFVMAIDPEAFTGRDGFQAVMRRYLETLRQSRPAEGETVLAPGDREWAEAERRQREGVPLDPDTIEAFDALSAAFGVAAPDLFGANGTNRPDNQTT